MRFELAAEAGQFLGLVGVGGFQPQAGIWAGQAARRIEQGRQAIFRRQAQGAAHGNHLAGEAQFREGKPLLQGGEIARLRGVEQDMGGIRRRPAPACHAVILCRLGDVLRAFLLEAGAAIQQQGGWGS